MVTPPTTVEVVLLAAGRGTRFGEGSPKQFELLRGRPLFAIALERLAALAPVGVVLALPPAGVTTEATEALDEFRERFPDIVLRTVTGGLRRQDSVARALRAIDRDVDVILVHDAARPFPPIEATRILIQSAMDYGGGLLAVPVVDTVKQEGPPGRVARTLDRSGLWMAQTPQAFRAQFIRPLERLLDGGEEFTDEASALERINVPVALVPGDVFNFKVTRPEDLRRAASFAEAMPTRS
jgi:2-C-methyl-D-erythritol 4-phosphate cytidylyltransferase